MAALLSEKELRRANRLLLMCPMSLNGLMYIGPLLRSISQYYPELELDIWLDDCKFKGPSSKAPRSEVIKAWLLQAELTSVVFPFAKSDGERQKYIRQAKRRHYDAIVYLSQNNSASFAQVAKMISRKALLVGSYPNNVIEQIRFFLHLRHVDRHYQLPSSNDHVSYLERYQQAFTSCFGNLPLAENDYYGLHCSVPYTAQQRVDSWLNEKNILDTDKLIVINPLSSSRKRDLSGAALKKLIRGIFKRYPTSKVILNIPTSSYVGMHALLKDGYLEDWDQNFLFLFTILDDQFELLALLNQASFIVTVESHVMHMASAIGVPQIAILRRKSQPWLPLRTTDILWGEGEISEIDESYLTQRALTGICCALEQANAN